MGNPKEAALETPHSYHQDGATAPPPYIPYHAPEDSHTAPSYEAVPIHENAGSSRIAGVSSRFPHSLNAYFPKMGLARTFHLGEHADQRQFAVTMHSGLTSKPLMELHAGPNESDAIIATANNESRWGSGRKFVIQVLPPPEGPTPQQQSWQLMPQTVRIQQKNNWKHVTYPFSAEVGLGKDVRREEFEWRHSRGGEIKELDNHAVFGWKLVRLGSASTGEGGERKTRSSGATSDGLEVIAVWSHSTSWSVSKVFKFQFLESGATGVLGESLALIALMSALKVWYMEYVQSAGAASSSASAGAAAASVG